MDSSTEFSIIIPIYKVEYYLRKCLDSIMAQSFNNWEAILVDDGSPDNCPQICDEYAEKDARFRVFHIENGGVSQARNIGLSHARGKYIAFLDADDYLSNNYFCVLRQHLSEKTDMLYYGYIYISDGNSIHRRFCNKSENISLKILCKRNLFSGYVWAYIYKRSIIEEHKLRFSTQLKYAEDWEFILKYYCHIDQMEVITDCLYYQIQREGSATQRKLGETYLQNNFLMFDSILSYSHDMPFFFKRFLFIQLYCIIIWFVNNVISTNKALQEIYKLLVGSLRKKHITFCVSPIVWLPYTNTSLFKVATKILNKIIQ